MAEHIRVILARVEQENKDFREEMRLWRTEWNTGCQEHRRWTTALNNRIATIERFKEKVETTCANFSAGAALAIKGGAWTFSLGTMAFALVRWAKRHGLLQ